MVRLSLTSLLRFQQDISDMAFDLQMSPNAEPQEIYDKIRTKAAELSHAKEDCPVSNEGIWG